MTVDWIVCDGCGLSGGQVPFLAWREGAADWCPDCKERRAAEAKERAERAEAEQEADAIADEARAAFLATWGAARKANPVAEEPDAQ